MKNNVPFYIIVLGLFLGVCAPSLWSDGMFMDGLYYATISRNLSEGLGSFWQLYFTEISYPIFYEHPPLAIGLQSIFFQIFGDSIYVERFYSLSTFIITGVIIHLIWKKISTKELKDLSWIPLFFWIMIPLNSWACSNNMLENTMNIFVSLSVLFSLKSLDHCRVKNILFAGICLSLAFLSKGFVGLFPLSIFFWQFLVFKEMKIKEMLSRTALLLFFAFMPFVILYIFQPIAIDSLSYYIYKQVYGSIQNIPSLEKFTPVESRFFIVKKLIMEFLLPLLLCLIAFFFRKKKSVKINKNARNWILFFVLLGLAGVVPIMISIKQSGFYILTTFPLFCIACGLFVSPLFTKLSINKFKLYLLSIIILMSSIALSVKQIGVIGRNKEMLEDIHAILTIVPNNSMISIDKQMGRHHSLIAYFARYANVSLNKKEKLKYHISYESINGGVKGYTLVNLDSRMIFLYEKVKVKKEINPL